MSSPTKPDIPISKSISSADTTINQSDSELKLESSDDRSTTDEKEINDKGNDNFAAAPDVEVDLENGEGTELKRKALTIIPRKNRRGLFAQLVIGIPEIEDPVQYSRQKKNV